LRDRFRKRRLRPGTVGGRIAFTACGAGTGRTGRKPPLAVIKEDRPPANGRFLLMEMAESTELVSSGWPVLMGFHDPTHVDWLSGFIDVPALAASRMGRLEPAAEARRAWARAGMLV
jgi:hypothetical protein